MLNTSKLPIRFHLTPNLIKVSSLGLNSESKRQKNLLFLPGGPGFDSAYLLPLAEKIYEKHSNEYMFSLLDLPGNGTNSIKDPNFSNWATILVDFLKEVENPIIISHSFASIFLLSIEDISEHVDKLILISACLPGKIGNSEFSQKNNLPNLTDVTKRYFAAPSNDALKNMYSSQEYAYYYFSENFREKGMNYLSETMCEHKAFNWSLQDFLPNWKNVITPTAPTMLISGIVDGATPFEVIKNYQEFAKENISICGIENAGHFPWVENGDAVFKQINTFLS